jgi:hypothetical protein
MARVVGPAPANIERGDALAPACEIDQKPHTATPDEPYGSPYGKACSRINQAVERGEMTTEKAIAAYRAAVMAP